MPVPPKLENTEIAREIGGLALSCVRAENPMLLIRAACWRNTLRRIGVHVPFFVVHDVGLLLCADGGGSNGYRVRLWKLELQGFAQETGLQVTVCHLPPGTSKWNQIEHRLFSHISMNWRGRPLISHQVVVQLISATTTRKGLRVHAELDTAKYPTHVKVTKDQMRQVNLHPHPFHGEWNYTIEPKPS